MTPVLRHRWITVSAAALEAVAWSGAAEHRETVRAWLARGLPLVARSRQPDDDADLQPVGLSLPSASGKLKIALQVAFADIERIDPPATLKAVAAVLQGKARAVARAMAAEAHSLGFTAHAFGSAAWQWRTGETYLHAQSDLDMLAAPPTASALRAWLEYLRRLESRTPMRIDGEIEAAGGDAINWRELAGAASQLLVKSTAGARLADRRDVEMAWT